jgi:hypothetical protein
MNDQQHPITPPPELVQQWKRTAPNWYWATEIEHYHYITLCAAQWGADQELEACCEWTQGYAECGDSLRAARRPKPPSLKEQALEALGRMDQFLTTEDKVTILRALEQLDD